MESLLVWPRETRESKDEDYTHHKDDDLLFESLLSDDEWPMDMMVNKVENCFEWSSLSSRTTTANRTTTMNVAVNNNNHEPSSSSSFSSPSYFYPSYLSDEPLGDDVNLRPIKKRRKRNRPRAHPFPRIVKHDLRRVLHQMYFNTVNSGDIALYQRFLSEFCVGSCCLMKNLDDSGIYQTLKEMKPISTIRGLDNITNFLTKRIFSFPDVISHVEKSWIRHQLNTPGSAVIAKVKIQGTLPEDICTIDALRITGDEQYNIQGCIASRYDVLLEAFSVFHLDNDNRIYRLEFHGQLQTRVVSI